MNCGSNGAECLQINLSFTLKFPAYFSLFCRRTLLLNLLFELGFAFPISSTFPNTCLCYQPIFCQFISLKTVNIMLLILQHVCTHKGQSEIFFPLKAIQKYLIYYSLGSPVRYPGLLNVYAGVLW